MLKTNNPNELSINQLQAILNNDNIRQHLVQAGYIDHRGNIIDKDDDNGQSRRLYTSNSRRNYQRPMGNIINSNGQVETRSSDNRRLKSASTFQSKGSNKSRFSTLNQSTYVHNVLLRRAVSPKILSPNDRCHVTLQYYGPDLNIEYDRDYFEPEGDEILVMQQHCGGENFLAFKGFLKPDDLFSFQSRRHTDYPFALAFYVNGIIKNRLSICCESRCKNSMRIGGKHCLFAIIKVEKAKVCRRCRYEERMKKLIEAEPKSSTATDRSHRQKSDKTHASSSKSSTTPTKNSESTSGQTMNQKTTAARSSSPEKNGSDKSNSKLTVAVRKSSPESTISRPKSVKINGVRSSSPQQVESGTSSPEATVSNHQPQRTNSPNAYLPDFEEPKKRIHSAKPTSRKNKPPQVSSSDSSDSGHKIQQPGLIISHKRDSDDEILSDESNPDFERFVAGVNRQKNTDN